MTDFEMRGLFGNLSSKLGLDTVQEITKVLDKIPIPWEFKIVTTVGACNVYQQIWKHEHLLVY